MGAQTEQRHRRMWADADPTPFWLDSPLRPAARESLHGLANCDLAVVGGGFSGLWTAVLAAQRDPGRRIVLVEGERIGGAATGRNGGFCAASLTHGEANGRTRFAAEYDTLNKLGLANLDAIERAVADFGIDCGWERTGELDVATEAHQIEDLRSGEGEFLDTAAVRAEVNSPTYLAGSWNRDGCAMVDPARLAWGLAAAAESLGVRIVENTPVTGLDRDDSKVVVSTSAGRVVASHVALGTNAFRPLLRRLRLFTVPVYDYVLVTEPLSAAQLATIGWQHRQGLGDSANQFHYYRLTADNRILWGGYDAIYHLGRRVRERYDQRPATYDVLAAHFASTFPSLADVRFTHRWGGAIDTCTRFCAFYGTTMSGRVAYALGYTGLGVGATRFGADVMLDLLSGRPTERTELEMVRSTPLPFPPEPFAYAGVQLTRHELARADRNDGRRGLFLKTLDRLGLGFDS